MKTAEIELGGEKFTIEERPTLKNKQWRRDLASKLKPVVDLIEMAPTLNIPTSVDEWQSDTAGLASITSIVKQLSTFLLDGLDDVLDLTIDYSPALKKKEKWIGENAYDSEVLEAFTRVLGLAYPFGGIARALKKIQSDGPGSTTK